MLGRIGDAQYLSIPVSVLPLSTRIGAMALVPYDPQHVTFRTSWECADMEVVRLGPFRPIFVSMEWAINNLAPLMHWITNTWVGVRKRVRKTFSHYGALMMTHEPMSGRDPGNRVYAFALHVVGNAVLTETEYYELERRGSESLGDIFESILGYAWWLRYRPQVNDIGRFEELLRRELDVLWLPDDIGHLWEVWEALFPLEGWRPWIERLVLGAEALQWQLPDRFFNRATWVDEFEIMRTTP